LIAFRHD
jgi:hypothetical protein